MSFKWPWMLWALLLVPVAVAGYALLQRRRATSAARFTTHDMLPNVVTALPRWRRHVPVALYLLALAALLSGLARPQALFAVPRERAVVMLVIDTSRSMEAKDVEPSRLEAARSAAASFLDQLPPAFQVGVVGFSDRAEILNRPTTDRVAVRSALGSLTTRTQTAIGDAIVEALKASAGGRDRAADDRDTPTVLLLLTDGNNTTGIAPETAVKRARRLGVPIFTIGLGRSAREGASPRQRPRPANFEFLEDIARRTGGEFFSAPTAQRLEEVYRGLGSEVSFVRENREITAGFVGAGLVLLLMGGVLSAFWFNRIP